MIKRSLLAILLLFMVILPSARSQIHNDVNPDSWAATDALGRTILQDPTKHPLRKDKLVAMFYWTWHQGNDDKNYQNKNVTEILRNHPEALKDYNHSAWGSKKPGFFFWEQPLLGYYKTTDKWVLRKHAEMLADAKVDVVFFDCTNGSFLWRESYEALLETWAQAKLDGVNVPKIAFMLPFGPVDNSLVSLRELYKHLYKVKKHQDLWFYWKGKPGIMAYPDNLTNDPVDKEIRDFFTFRPGQPDYVDGPTRHDQWAWLENYPQNGYVRDANGKYEQVAVGVAQNASPETNGHCSAFNLPGAQGRSFSFRNGFDPRIDGYLYGWNFQEQWDRAFELDPELVFVTGFNEFIAGQWLPKHGWTGDPFSFVDQFDWDRSRDIEPNKGWGDKGDVYYMQLIDNVRKFKGMQSSQHVSASMTINLGNDKAWEHVSPYYKHYKGNTFHRNHEGRYDQHYTNTTGRNDLVGAKVARDDANVYFYVETNNTISPSTDRNWMLLFLDTDRSKSSGWNGYDYVINRINPKNGKAILERNVGNRWEWEIVAEFPFVVRNNKLEIAISRSALNLLNKTLDFEFKWSDNMQENGNIMDFYVNGDVAPGGRFNFIYTTN
ncbi:MAG: hypothetical protein ACI35V_04075 [Sphingobacterium composti]|uniref:hypothetical protein n=1 Tax=Sphingobacterium composti TaxID=363260 RepID=UPI00191575DC|nr:hypothetical protein [Sphingobacterium composti Ten et al. 2007 non Yoo et al. 2007]